MPKKAKANVQSLQIDGKKLVSEFQNAVSRITKLENEMIAQTNMYKAIGKILLGEINLDAILKGLRRALVSNRDTKSLIRTRFNYFIGLSLPVSFEERKKSDKNHSHKSLVSINE